MDPRVKPEDDAEGVVALRNSAAPSEQYNPGGITPPFSAHQM